MHYERGHSDEVDLAQIWGSAQHCRTADSLPPWAQGERAGRSTLGAGDFNHAVLHVRRVNVPTTAVSGVLLALLVGKCFETSL